MILTIHKLATQCRALCRHETVVPLVDQIVRNRLPRELARSFPPNNSGHTKVVRIRRLHINLTLIPEDLAEDKITSAWTREFQKTLHEALARFPGYGSIEIVRADSPAAFRAMFIRDLLSGQAGGRWEYLEFEDLAGLPATEAALSLLLRFPQEIIATLTALDTSDGLTRLLHRLDEPSLERLFVAIATASGTASPGHLTIQELLWIADQILQSPLISSLAFDSRANALALFIRRGQGRLPRSIFHGVLTLACLLECPDLLYPSEDDAPDSPEFFRHRTGRWLPSAVTAALLELRRNIKKDTTASNQSFTQLLESLERLRPQLPTAAPPTIKSQSPWQQIDSTGLLLLTGTVQRLGWDTLRDDPFLSPWGGPRFFQTLLAGIATAVLGKPTSELNSLDPAVIIFAGMTHDPGLIGLRHTLSTIGNAGRTLLLKQLGGHTTAADDWPSTFDALANILIREFASQIRGFRQAPRAAIVRQFFTTPGRVQITEKLISVLLEPNPYHITLRIVGLDSPIHYVNWMNGRRLEFRLLGL